MKLPIQETLEFFVCVVVVNVFALFAGEHTFMNAMIGSLALYVAMNTPLREERRILGDRRDD